MLQKPGINAGRMSHLAHIADFYTKDKTIYNFCYKILRSPLVGVEKIPEHSANSSLHLSCMRVGILPISPRVWLMLELDFLAVTA